MADFRDVKTGADLEAALSADLAVIYKHSPHCGLSSMARLEVVFFAQGNPDVPVWEVDVIHDRALSGRIASRLDVEHESPQAILLRRGRPVFDTSHRGVSAAALERELERARTG